MKESEKMSLRHYLFALIGTLILLLTLVQLFLVYWIDKNLAHEVNEQAKLLSERVVDFAFDEVEIIVDEHNQEPSKIIHLPTQMKQTKVIVIPEHESSSEKNVQVLKEQVVISDESTIKPADKILIKKRLETLFDSLEQDKLNGVKKFIQKHPNSQGYAFEHIVTTSETSQSLIQSIQLMILVCALMAIAFAYWLSMQFNKPLNSLRKGFDALTNQDYNYRITPHGVNEIKQTMLQFNDMLETLAKLKKIEQHYKDTAHLAELGEVSRGLAHTLRNPIHTIGLSVEQLATSNLDESQRVELANTIQTKILHIDQNIKSLLTLTTNGITRDQQVPVLAVVQDIILEVKSAQMNQPTFDVTLPNSLTITGAESEIRSILHTLIINACEASPSQGCIKVYASSTKDQIEVVVEDEGEGLDTKIEHHLFQPHNSGKPEGAGMGLYIAQRIISLHYQGHISLKNAEKKGCIASAIFRF